VKSLLLFVILNDGSAAERWPIPASTGGVLQNLDRPSVRLPAPPAGEPRPAAKAEMHITITARSQLDVTLICRTRGELFNHDLPGERPDPSGPGAECSQVAGEKGTERIEDTRGRKAGRTGGGGRRR
jgi:hypothetical protein